MWLAVATYLCHEIADVLISVSMIYFPLMMTTSYTIVESDFQTAAYVDFVFQI